MLASQISAASAPVQIAGRALVVSPLSDRDFDELSLWHQGRILRIARASLDAQSTPSEREETLKAAFAYASGIDFFTEAQTGGILGQKEVMVQFVWRLMRKGQAFSMEDAKKIVESGDGIDTILDAWHLVQFGTPGKAVEDPRKNDSPGV